MPVTVIGDRAIMGFNPSQLSEALHLGIKVAARDPAETIPLLGRVMEAVQRVVRQMPDDKLDWTAPDRDRPMREFAYHIFNNVHAIIQGINTGVFPPRSDSTDASGRSYNSFQHIADYGGTVIEELRAWEPKQNLDSLRKPPPADSDGRSTADRLDLVTGHSIQHLRQLYWVIENFGITANNRMPDSEFPPEYVLTIISPTGGLF